VRAPRSPCSRFASARGSGGQAFGYSRPRGPCSQFADTVNSLGLAAASILHAMFSILPHCFLHEFYWATRTASCSSHVGECNSPLQICFQTLLLLLPLSLRFSLPFSSLLRSPAGYSADYAYIFPSTFFLIKKWSGNIKASEK
jgi:hypothetical protein